MTIRLYDTLTRGKRDFEPRDPDRVTMYVCGPTVYNHIHIGNARTFLTFDVIRRYLSSVYGDEGVTFVRNITDVDDKIIERAREEERTAAEVAEEYSQAFRDAMAALGIDPPDAEPLATETIPDMIGMVERLIEKGHAYEVDGDVYFSVRSFDGYGKLSGRDIDDLRSGSRVDVDERKQDPLDFALWKSAKPGEPDWDSPWGQGRPGWHLECSVMSTGELGESFDIHGGGSDLVFPHHENEIAQSEADTGVPFARYWLHGGMLQINQEKMSKSLGNFTLLKEVLERYPAAVIRLLMLQTHYRSPLDFSDSRLDEAATSLQRLGNAVRDAREGIEGVEGRVPTEDEMAQFESVVGKIRDRFSAEMDDDFNTAGALGVLFEAARTLNRFREDHGMGDERQAKAIALAADSIESSLAVLGLDLGLGLEETFPASVIGLATDLVGYEGEDSADAVSALLAARTQARGSKDWAAADAIRDGLAALDISIEDTPQGPRASTRG